MFYFKLLLLFILFLVCIFDGGEICNMIARSNTIPFWVATEIVHRDNLEERVAILRKFIFIADHCRALCNYNALMEILSGLNMTAVSHAHDVVENWLI
jgi:hypothetical protein